MQDRFKFRIFDTENKTMHNTDFVVCSTGFVGKLETEDDGKFYVDNYNLTIDNKCILMQCTGLKDKNGKLIFEGDIVKFRKLVLDGDFFRKTDAKSYITYLDGCFCIADELLPRALNANVLKDLEVIGNIHETPELLEGENE